MIHLLTQHHKGWPRKETDSHNHSKITDQLPAPTLTHVNKCEYYKQTTVDHMDV